MYELVYEVKLTYPISEPATFTTITVLTADGKHCVKPDFHFSSLHILLES